MVLESPSNSQRFLRRSAYILPALWGLDEHLAERLCKEAVRPLATNPPLRKLLRELKTKFEQVVDDEMARFFADLEKAIDKAPSGREKLKVYCKMRLKKIDKMCNLSHALRNDMIESMAIILAIKRKHETRHIELVNSIFDFGMQEREFKKLTVLETERLSNLFVTLFKGMELPACITNPPDQQEMTDFMVDTLIEGIGR